MVSLGPPEGPTGALGGKGPMGGGRCVSLDRALRPEKREVAWTPT